jgi:hypothetical protein
MLKKLTILILMAILWAPQPGPQVKAAACPADVLLFGGSRGGGKSDCLLGRQLRGADRFGQDWNGIIFRRKYKDFKEMRRRVDGLIRQGLPAVRIGGDQQENYLKFGSGAQVTLAAAQNLDMIGDHVGQQYTEIGIDEATTFPFFSKMVDKLRGSRRSPAGVPGSIFCTGNPGGPGHAAVKEFFRLGKAWQQRGQRPGQVFRTPITFTDPITGKERTITTTRVFLPSFLHDNKILWEKDPTYVAGLLSINDEQLRRAWIDGDWDVFIGQAFVINDRHLLKPHSPPPYAPVYMSFDWGYGKPFSVGWWYLDDTGRLVRFSEWYGWNGFPDEGLRLEDSSIAEGIIEHERRLNIHDRVDDRIAGPDSFNKKPNYQGGGQGPSTAEVFDGYGLHMRPGDPIRTLKIRQFRERIALPSDGSDRPMLLVTKNCEHFLRTIPALCYDEDEVEDIDTEQEDHVYDEAALMCMARPMRDEAAIKKEIARKQKDVDRAELDTTSQAVWAELDKIRQQLDDIHDA